MYERPKEQSNFDDVGDFHQKFGLENVTHQLAGPRPVTPELLEFRLKFLLEEVIEFAEAAGYTLIQTSAGPQFIQTTEHVDHAKVFDALLDEVYVAMGTAHLLGYPWREGWAAVQEKNMQKIRAQSDGSDSKRGSSLDVVKPEGWTPPDIGAVLQRFGFNFKDDE